MPVKRKNNPPQGKRFDHERGSNAGKRSAEVRRERRDLRELARTILACPAPLEEPEIEQIRQTIDDDINVGTASLFALARKSVSGDQKAFELLLKIAGEPQTPQERISESLWGDF